MYCYIIACVDFFGKNPDNPESGVYMETLDKQVAIDSCIACNQNIPNRFAIYVFKYTGKCDIHNPDTIMEV